MLHHSPGTSTLVAAALGWTAMMGLMMAPTVAPWVLAYHRFGLTAGPYLARLRGTVSFALGYFVVWSLFGLAVAVVQTHIAVTGPLSGLLLAAAGGFQFTALKQACLT